MRQSWLRKVQELKITPGISGSEAFFRSNLSIFVLRTKVSMWKKINAIETAQVLKLEEDEWQALRAVEIEPPPSETGPIARRSPMQAVMELLPALTHGERHCVLFKLAAMNGPAVESRELALLATKQAMQQVLRERPLSEWGEALAPFVHSALLDAGDRRVAFKYPDACTSGLMLLIAHPPHDWGTRRHDGPSWTPPCEWLIFAKRTTTPWGSTNRGPIQRRRRHTPDEHSHAGYSCRISTETGALPCMCRGTSFAKVPLGKLA